MTTFGEERAKELGSLSLQVRDVNLLDGQIISKNGPATIQNCLYFIEHDDEIWNAAEIARNQCLAFAEMLERRRHFLLSEADGNLTGLRTSTLVSIENLRKAVLKARPSIEAKHLGLG